MTNLSKTPSPAWKILKRCTAGCLTVALITGCGSIQSFINSSRSSPEEASLEIQVTPGPPASGLYDLSGTANLPDGTALTIMAIRYLHLRQPALQAAEPEPTYSILAFDVVETRNNRWQSQLALRQIAPDGQYQEAWQLHESDLDLAVDPDPAVVFLATLSPMDDLEAIEQQLSADNQQFASRFVRVTAEGDRYLQAAELQEIPLPRGATVPVATAPEDINGGWGNRFLQLPDPPNLLEFEFPDNRQTNAPLSSEELLY